ncbi:MAG TPA: HAMP domain-containing sensor histidine kinase, partial [Polyangia bacterium]|nr:HAMP domain-containing sensor histidine kinase [Polyangia bacterium]
FERRPVRVSDLVADALGSFEAIKFGANVDLQVKIEPGLMVYGDRAALAQAVGNLLANAWKYTRPEGKRIEVSATGEGKRVSITVTDNGLGIRRGEQAAIFEKFQRGSAGLQSGAPGSGLGLALVQAVVTAHHGKVDVRSEPERGARLRIVLPRCPETP